MTFSMRLSSETLPVPSPPFRGRGLGRGGCPSPDSKPITLTLSPARGEGTKAIELTRRGFLAGTSLSLGAVALNELLAADDAQTLMTHFAPKAKRAIYLFQSGAPSQLDLFDDKPLLKDRTGQDLPDSIRQGQRLTG